jgi:hypothetical protein
MINVCQITKEYLVSLFVYLRFWNSLQNESRRKWNIELKILICIPAESWTLLIFLFSVFKMHIAKDFEPIKSGTNKNISISRSLFISVNLCTVKLESITTENNLLHIWSYCWKWQTKLTLTKEIRICWIRIYYINTTCAISGAGTAYPAGAPELTSGF